MVGGRAQAVRAEQSRDAVASPQPCPSSGNSTAVGDRCSGVLFLLPGQGWDSRTGPPAQVSPSAAPASARPEAGSREARNLAR